MPDPSHVVVRDVLSAAELARIGEDLDESTLTPGMVSSGGVASDVRANTIAWLRRPGWQWLYDRLHMAATGVNSWGLDVTGATDEVQFARYAVGEHYGWHTDSAEVDRGSIARRTVSIVALVSSAGAGGVLEIRDADALALEPGDAVVFPAVTEHRATAVTEGTRESVVLWLAQPPAPEAPAGPVPVDWRAIEHLEPPADNPDSPWFMSAEMFAGGIDQLVADGALVLPYGFLPGSYPGGVATAVQTSWARWKRRYGFNPPDFLKHLPEYAPVDAAASAKPSWQTIRAAALRRELATLRASGFQAIEAEGERRIMDAYGARDLEHEFKIRLAAKHTEAEDAERVRLAAKHAELETWLESDERTAEELRAFDATLDSHWAAPDDEE